MLLFYELLNLFFASIAVGTWLLEWQIWFTHDAIGHTKRKRFKVRVQKILSITTLWSSSCLAWQYILLSCVLNGTLIVLVLWAWVTFSNFDIHWNLLCLMLIVYLMSQFCYYLSVLFFIKSHSIILQLYKIFLQNN